MYSYYNQRPRERASKMEDLVKHLIQNGIEEDTANKIAASYEEEATVDTENLQKALDGIAAAMQENDTTDTDAAIAEAQDVAEAVTRGADALLAEVREQNDALAKGLLAIGEEMRAVRTFLNTQYTAVAQVTEQVETVKKSLTEPTMQKSVTATSVESPYEATETVDPRAEMITKALGELQTSTVDSTRQATLRKAITQLECGVPVATVRSQFGI